jgi:PAS domain S-box-containing protein
MSDAPTRKSPQRAPASPLPTSWYQVTLSAIGDAVLTTDVEGRVTYMNAAAESLTGWETAAALTRPLEDVFRIVNEQTRGAVEQPVRKVLETGLIRGLDPHTILIARDGTERPIDDSASPIHDEGGTVLGIVMVFHDESSFRDFEVDHVFESVGRRRLVLNGRKLWTPENQSELILIAIEDITRGWRVGVEFGDSRERYRVIIEGAMSYAIFTFDMQGLVTSWNRGGETIATRQGGSSKSSAI